MISKFKSFAAAPVFPDPEKTRLAKLLNKILLAVIAIFSFTTILTPFRPEPYKDIIFTLLAILLVIFIFIIMRRGHVKTACWLITLLAYLAICLSIFVFGGVRSSYNSLIVVITITAILLGPKATVFMGLLTIFTGWLYLTAETQGFFVPQSFYHATNNIWFTQTINFILITMLLGLSSQSLTQALNKARKSEDALSQKNEALIANTQVLEEQETILRKVLAELSASDENYRTVFNATNEAIFIQEATTGRILDVNQAMVEMYGYSYEESLNANVVDLSLGKPPYSEVDALAHIKKASREGPQLFEWLAKRKNGELFWVEVALKRTDIGGQSRALAVVRDITERKNQEADREALITKLEQKNDELERFTYTISHDLKSPLITINGFLGYLEQDAATGNLESVTADLTQIRKATTRMQQLLDELLELSRIGRLRNEIKMVSFNEVVDEAQTAVSGQLVTKGIELIIQPEMPFVMGDYPRLVAVVQNLLDNAIKFMGTSPEPRIEIGIISDEAGAIFYVQDNGMGVEPRYQKKVFDLFERLNPDIEGTGLGLALAKRIIEMHNGRFWLESEGLGKGSTFFFTIPDPTPSELNDFPNPDHQTET